MSFVKSLLEMMSTRPEAWAWAFWVPCFMLLLAVAKGGLRLKSTGVQWVGGAIGLLALVVFGWFSYHYLVSQQYLNAMPTQIFEVSWYFEQGHPLYHDAQSPEIYSMLYGPYLYIFTGTLEKLLGPSVLAAKLAGQLATASALGLLLVLLWCRGAKLSTSLFLTGIFACLIVLDPLGAYLDRADNFIVLFVVLGAWAAYSPWKIASIAFGVALGISVNLKVHAFLYFIPLAWLAWRTGYRGKSILATLATAAFVALLPFWVYSNISLSNYLWILRTAAHHGLNAPDFVNVVVWVGCLTLPMLTAVWLVYKQDASATADALRRVTGLIGWLAVASIVLIIPASKNASGPYHFLPMAIMLPLLIVELAQAGMPFPGNTSAATAGMFAVILSWLISCCGAGILRSYQYAAFFKMRASTAAGIQTEIDEIQQKYGYDHILLMGNSDNDHFEWTQVRASLVFSGQPVGLEPVALMDMEFGGVRMPTLPEITTALMAREPGRKIIWLVPNEGVPFSMHSYYASWANNEYQPSPPVYDEKFRKDFGQTFQRIASTQHFDLYSN